MSLDIDEIDDLDVAELNVGDLATANDPVLRLLDDDPAESGWRQADDEGSLATRARDLLEHSDLTASITGLAAAWQHASGRIAVQFDTSDETVLTLLLVPR